ncbi:TIGR04255 family protein [Shewanella sp. FJAT-51649]|uniref:TIGR04255 family protein n=1 Tax=Shewanella sp. FJAT-51649 TaxID=2864210 RepID=UPI001C65555E|nr:TIGR04255 family protein [Shewanella sp. FJAT-51649]QYJ71175.1 TIGR04255 family protein [Shewanella sp. FJAT-51649]
MNHSLEPICYNKNYLVEVVARIDFATPAESLSTPVLPKAVRDIITKRYAIHESNKGVRQGFEISEHGVKSQNEEYYQWTFSGSEREKSITINKDSITVSLKKYIDWKEFKLDVFEPIKSIVACESTAYIARTGLRFINIFDDVLNTRQDVDTYFSPMIASPISNLDNESNCSRSFLITEYLHNEIKLRMQTGIYNPDYPAKIKKLDFIVDLDAYVDTPHAFNEIDTYLDDLHQKVQMHFESCITENLKRILST